MPKHYTIAKIPDHLSHEMAIEVQKKINSGYTLEFKSDFKDVSIWVLSKMVTWDEFNNEVNKELKRSEDEKKKLESFAENFKQDVEQPKEKWYSDPDLRKGFESVIYILIGMALCHILTIL